MDTILALLGLALLAVPVATAMGLLVLWSRVSQHGRNLEAWRNELWNVQRAGADLERRVIGVESGLQSAWQHAQTAEAASRPPAPRAVVQASTGLAAWSSVVAAAWPSPAAPRKQTPSVGDELSPHRMAEPPIVAEAAVDHAVGSSDDVAAAAFFADADVSAPAPVAPPPKRGSAPISLEQWLGVRGAAAMGAAVLVLAGIYFFKYSIDNGLLTTTMRVALGALAGAVATAGAEIGVRRRHELLANCLVGAGMAIFYITFWAAFARYGLIGAPVAGALMVVVTVSSCMLAIRRSSLAIAMLALVGGFATPSMLSSGSDRPFMLFSYILLLDVALLFVAYKRRWPGLALLSLVGTSGYQALWIVGRMGPERLGLGMLLCAVFSMLFAAAGERREPDERDDLWRWTRASALAIPMGFAVYLSVAPDLHATFLQVATLLVGLLSGAAVVARRETWPWLLKATVFPALGVLAVWIARHGVAADAGAMGALVVVVAVLLQTVAEVDHRDEHVFAPTSMSWVAGAMLVTITGVAYLPSGLTPWPWMLTWLALALVAMRNGSLPGREPVLLASVAGLGVGLLLVGAQYLPETSQLEAELFVGFAVLLVIVHQLASLLLSYPAARAMSGHAAALLPLMLTMLLPLAAHMRPAVYAAATLTLLALGAFATLRNGATLWLVVATCVTGLAQWWPWQLADLKLMSAPWAGPTVATHEVSLFAHGAAALMICGFPLLANERARAARWTWRAAALAPVIMFLPMLTILRRLVGDESAALLALGMGAMTLTVLGVARTRRLMTEAVDRSATAWLGAVTLGFVTAAIPLAVDHEWVTIGWALLATALIALWRRVDHAGLRYSALALSAVVFLRLVLVVNVASYHAEVGWPVFNWLAYTYLVPIACLCANLVLLHGVERERLRGWEPVRPSGEPLAPMLYASAAIILGFVWLNLTVVDWFSASPGLDVTFERMPARDLTMSIVWAVYALGLLGAGMWRKAGALRKASLGLVLLTCGKVFLFDLAYLEDLYRVMSLTGLALSLIAVSFAYHRFVFRDEEPE